MGKLIDLTGQKFGRLTVIERTRNNNNKVCWICRCECGNLKTVAGKDIKSGNTRSCGCIKHESKHNPNYKHGLKNEPIYKVWRGIKNRCYNTASFAYSEYGGRGITVCAEWLHDFQAFYDWAITNGYKKGLTIDRIDNNKGYAPDNCRWVTMRTQNNNKRNNHIVFYNGEKYTIAELAMKYGVDYDKLQQRISRYHWNIEEALNTP